MADPRGRGFKRSNAFRHRPRPRSFDCPKSHGWVEVEVSEVDGCIIFGLDGIAQMKADLSTPGQWVGNVLANGHWQGFVVSGPLDQITKQLQAMAENAIFADALEDETEDYQPDYESIPWDGEPIFGGDELGLEAR